jgi:phenylalanyl-tRNA synthetase beta chain
LEAAFFTPNKLHRTSRELRLRTDSSIRFEKGLDWGRLIDALDKAANLIAQLGGGTICKGRIDIKKKERKPEKIKLSLELVNGVLGTTLKAAQVAKILKNLGFGVVGSSTSLTVTIPFSRGYDVYRPIDLVEEVARVYGYEKIPASLPNTIFETKFDESREKLRLVARQVLAGKGLTETMSYSLIDPKELEKINLPVESILRMPIKLANPLAQEQSVMRTSLLPSLMSVLSHNINRQVKDVRIFECSKIYFGKAPDQITEKEMLAGVLAGNLVSGKITNKGKADLTFSHLKGIVEDLIEALGLGKAEIMPLPHYLLHPGIAAVIRVGGVEIGNFGRLNPAIENNYDLKLPVFAFEIDLEKVFGLKPPAKRYRPLPKFPQVERDLAILVEGSVNNATIVDKILKTGVPLVKEVILFDQYLGENLGGKKSLAYRIIYQDPQRTLTDEIVAAKHLEISNALAEQLGASLR